mgnify:CR=1 FL=1
MNEQLNQEENNTLKHEDILEVFEKLIKYLRLAKKNLRKNHKKILEELEKWHSEITIQEIENGLNLILNSSNKWFNLYKKTNDILQIPLKEYDLISKESAYILGDCALIKELYIEIIDFQIGCIGGIMCQKIKNGGSIKW